MIRRLSTVRAVLLLGIWVSAALGVKPETWEQTQPKDFLSGKLENIVVSSLGEVTLGRESKPLGKLADDIEIVNTLARSEDGKVYAGTGPTGRIYRAEGEAMTEFAKLPDGGNILSLLFTEDGMLLAGTGGGSQARIYRIDGAGKASVFFEPPDGKYVWAMVRGASGEIYAATGVEGKIYRIEPDGKTSKVLADLKPKNVLCLAIGTNGMLYAGTDEDGLVNRINPTDGKAFVLYDAKEAEISSIVLDADGSIFASTAAAESARPGRSVADKPGGTPDGSVTRPSTTLSTQATAPAGGNGKAATATRPATSAPGATPRSIGKTVGKPAGTDAGNAIYRIDANGFVTEVFREPVIILCMAEADGTIVAGTGNEGRIYSIIPTEDRTTMLAKLESAQATSILRLPDGQLVIGTANAAGLVQMPDKRASKGTLVSKPQDAGQVVRWGRISADASILEGTKITVAARSSNVEDEESPAWEDWSSELDLSTPQQVPCTSARFLQYRLTFETTSGDKTPLLRSLSVPYIEENRAPVISAVEVVSAREEAQKPTAASAVKAIVGASAFGGQQQPGPEDFWVVKWKAEDPNKDTMEYEVFYRQVGTTKWIRIGKEIKETLKIWDTRTVEDGRYELRVLARDKPSNPAGTDLSIARVSDMIIVDNTAPSVSIESVEPKAPKSIVVHAKLSDTGTPIAEAAYTIDSDDEWIVLAADDDIFDSKAEAVTFTVSEVEPGEHRISIRVRDDHGNAQYASRTVTTGQ